MFIAPAGNMAGKYQFQITAATSTVYIGYAAGFGSISPDPSSIDGAQISSFTDVPGTPRFFFTFSDTAFDSGDPTSMQIYVNGVAAAFLVTKSEAGIWWNASNALGLVSGETYLIGVDLNY